MAIQSEPKPDVDRKTAKGKGEGGFNPHPDKAVAQEVKRGGHAKDEARRTTPAGKGRSQ